MVDALDGFPLTWGDRRVQEVRDALAAGLYRTPVIEEIVDSSALPAYDVNWNGSARLIWTSVMNVAAAQLRMPALLKTAAERQPALMPRLAELRAEQPVLSARVPAAASAALAPADVRWKGFTADGRERRMVETNDTLLDIAFLERGLQKARAVCRLTVSVPAGIREGTAFRIGPSLLLTNHHVVHDWDDGDVRALSVEAAFGYELDLDGRLRTATVARCDVGSIRGERENDWAVLATVDPVPDAVPALSLAPPTPVRVDDRVIIVQHPRGLPKKIGLAHNLVRHVDDDVLQYWTDTEAGSSGAPVFDELWNVVGLHHWWVESPVDGDGAFRNQGRNIRRVAERIAQLKPPVVLG
jgi:S1-C subfamily serine protease